MACALFWRAALGLLRLCNCELNSHAPIDRVGEDYGNVERWSMESCPPFPPATSHEASAPHLSPNSILRFPISCHSFLPSFYPQNGLLSEKPQSTALSNKLLFSYGGRQPFHFDHMLLMDWDVDRITDQVKRDFFLQFDDKSNLKVIELRLNWKIKLDNRPNNLSTKTMHENGWICAKLHRNVS